MKDVLSELEVDGSKENGIAPRSQRTIAICDANPVLSDGIRQILQDDAFLSDFIIVADPTPDLSALTALAPDILIIDPRQQFGPRETATDAFLGLSDVSSLIGYCPEITSVDARALNLVGFRGLMPKTVRSEELVRAVSAVAFGGVYLHESYANTRVGSVMHADPDAATLSDLSEREIEVLRRVALGISMKEIAALLKISIKTVDTYKARANRKLNLRSRSDIVQYAIQSGWMN